MVIQDYGMPIYPREAGAWLPKAAMGGLNPRAEQLLKCTKAFSWTVEHRHPESEHRV